LLAALTLVLTMAGLGGLEFFRHTESDRTLIAWEMLQRHDFLVPRLLGDVILTKPPLYYWILAATIALLGNTAEWVVRLPSALAATLFIVAQYLFVRRAGGTPRTSLLFAVCLATGAGFLLDAQRAEIEMVFGLFCALGLYSLYIGLTERSAGFTIAAYVWIALAFLTKGPPALLFFGATFAVFAPWLAHTRRRRAPPAPSGAARRAPGQGDRRLARSHAIGIALFSLLVGGWLLALASRVGWPQLVEQVRVEIFQRVLDDPGKARNLFFYPWRFFWTLFPWGPFLLVTLATPLLTRRPASRTGSPAGHRLLVFNAVAVATAFVLLSFSSGKSSRYLYPVYACGINLAVFGVLTVRGTRLERWLRGAGTAVAGTGAVALALIPLFRSIPGVRPIALGMACGLLAAAAAWFGWCCHTAGRRRLLVAIVLLVAAVRAGEILVYIPRANARASVRPVAEQIAAHLPPGAPLLVEADVDRRLAYYVMRSGHRPMVGSAEAWQIARASGPEVHLLRRGGPPSQPAVPETQRGAGERLIATLGTGRETLRLVVSRGPDDPSGEDPGP
ncbi:MAG: glycosyltransferase family 39 protein, partial [Acidobacteriota bacterium]